MKEEVRTSVSFKDRFGKLFNHLWVKILTMMSMFLGLDALYPYASFALGWSPEQMMSEGVVKGGGIQVDAFSQQSLINWVTTITNWIVGIMIVIFVLKIVLTAVAKWNDGYSKGSGSNGGHETSSNTALSKTLQDIPVIGAYDPKKEWKDILIHYFAKNLAIIVGAWLIIQIIAGIVLWGFGAVTNGLPGGTR